MGSMTQEEVSGMHYGFLTIIKLAKDEGLINQYHQYYLAKADPNANYSDYNEKLRLLIDYNESSKKDLDPNASYYEASLKGKNTIIDKCKEYQNKSGSLNSTDKMVIDIYFDSYLFTTNQPMDKTSIDRFFTRKY
jgi:hypothetical protein